MGEEFSVSSNDELFIWFCVKADAPVKQVTLIKNLRDYLLFYHTKQQIIFDYKHETSCDCYYLRIELEDGRFGWTSPIWVNIK